MKISGTYNSGDIWAVHWLQIKPRRSFAIVGVILIALFLMTIVTMINDPAFLKSFPRWGIWTFVACAGYLAFVYTVWAPRTIRRKFREVAELNRLHTFEITEQGLAVSSETGHNTIPWSDFKKWKENKRVLLLYAGSFPYCMIPKRFFQAEQDYKTFIKILSEKISADELRVAGSSDSASRRT